MAQRGHPTCSDPKSDACYLGVKTEVVPLSPQGVGRLLRSATECGRSFKISGSLKSHMASHTGYRLHVCPECGRSFKRHMSLKSHRLSHTGERPFACPDCAMTFTRRHNLTCHRRQHSGETPYACGDCGRRFKQAMHLNVHIRRWHTSERPYRCSECDKCFVCPASRKVHMVVHTEERYWCPDCGHGYTRSGTLKAHKCQKRGTVAAELFSKEPSGLA
ncbi:hypothetical protein DPEC_G00170650 [Dallia pectoralis]|uniref:Uncharacterized protein n=1 Tax=Dallia pectoralis TaxID=75939 RepID=A0ACC2GDH6_DALPE|nr:hypothetical protein DPEC_G00170650 [Dallia pectoralis]